jgi:hypothetical protein
VFDEKEEKIDAYVSPLIIDFGFSLSNVPCNPAYEIVQLVRTLFPQFFDPKKRKAVLQNANYIYPYLYELNRIYNTGISLPSVSSMKWTEAQLNRIEDQWFEMAQQFVD